MKKFSVHDEGNVASKIYPRIAKSGIILQESFNQREFDNKLVCDVFLTPQDIIPFSIIFILPLCFVHRFKDTIDKIYEAVRTQNLPAFCDRDTNLLQYQSDFKDLPNVANYLGRIVGNGNYIKLLRDIPQYYYRSNSPLYSYQECQRDRN